MLKHLVPFAILLVALIGVAPKANAQSTIWNAPSTDVVAPHSVYVETDFLSRFAAVDKGGFQTYGGRLVFGPVKRMEVGFNTFFTKAGDLSVAVEIQPNMKFQFFNDEKHGLAASVGGVAYIPVNHREGTDTFAMTYSTFSKKVKTDFGPRITGGFYGLLGRASDQGSRTGALAGYEQPLHPKVNFVADWYSGKNRLGYAGGGFSFVVSKKSLLYVGYNLGNHGAGNNYFNVFYGYTF